MLAVSRTVQYFTFLLILVMCSVKCFGQGLKVKVNINNPILASLIVNTSLGFLYSLLWVYLGLL